ncbi:hypothetical protein HNY73_020713 [Argiope bruennichi]|uniref:Uncharacterized protein n=1 Tax=Argiope bruennichi TaxID=94029 RepID=A0A8T0EAC8_ARGBR|nr:hypothetical protein HNY73_020713 [Argiope bruennichi]
MKCSRKTSISRPFNKARHKNVSLNSFHSNNDVPRDCLWSWRWKQSNFRNAPGNANAAAVSNCQRLKTRCSLELALAQDMGEGYGTMFMTAGRSFMKVKSARASLFLLRVPEVKVTL